MAEDELQQVDEASPDAPPVEPTETPEADETPPEPKRDRISERFAKLTRALADKDRDIAALQQQMAELRPKAPAAPPTTERPTADQYEDYDRYVDAVAAWQAEQALARREQQERAKADDVQRQAREQTWAERLHVAQTKHPDWDEVLADADVPVTPALRESLLANEHGAEVLYWLATHQEEARSLAALSPFQTAMAVGRIEARLTSAPAPPAAEPEPPPPVAPPVAPVGGGRSGTTRDPGQMSPQEYRAWRERTGARRR